MQPNDDVFPQLLLTIPQAARALNISRAMLYSLIAKRQGPPVLYLGRSARVPLDSLRQWIQEQQNKQML